MSQQDEKQDTPPPSYSKEFPQTPQEKQRADSGYEEDGKASKELPDPADNATPLRRHESARHERHLPLQYAAAEESLRVGRRRRVAVPRVSRATAPSSIPSTYCLRERADNRLRRQGRSE